MSHDYKAMRLAIADNGVAEVVFTEAARGNPIDGAFCNDMNALSILLSRDEKVRAVLFRAEGKAFSFGGDLGYFNANLDRLPTVIMEFTAALHPAISRLQRMNAPIVGAIHGMCAGGMVALMAGCDLLVASDNAKFLAAYAGIGYSCDAGSSIMLTKRMGLPRARRFLLLNEMLDASAALAAGLVDEVVPADALMTRANAIASTLADGPTAAIGETRRLLMSASDQGLETQLELEAQALVRVACGVDAREGISAFASKRKPVFVGR